MKRIWPGLLAAALLALSTGAQAITVGVSMAVFDDNFLTAVRASMKDRARQLNVAVQFEDAHNDIGRQLNQIQNFIARHVDAIVVNPVDTDATPRMTDLAVAAGIPLVYVNRMPADGQLPPNVSFVGSDETQSGTLQMTEVCRLLGGRGDIVVLMGQLTNQSARQRTRDIDEVIARPACRGIRVLDRQAANWKRTEAADLVTNWLSAGLRPAAVVANDDEMAIGAIQALRQAHLLSSTIVAGIDATPDALAEMESGGLRVTVFQNAPAQGRGAIETALRLARHEVVPSFVWVPFELVTRDNLASYLPRH
ncbi:MAG TPA: sugar ABC transporter substrate-binding protein [Steroidobacteraceae bacterium]|nr:sugar ABC transporter substrate-binding protein [Steroidobacteraceae bacterium]